MNLILSMREFFYVKRDGKVKEVLNNFFSEECYLI